MTRPHSLLIATCSLMLPLAAAAQDDPLVLDKVVLSAGLSPIVADGYARAHSVLTAEEIGKRGITNVQDALRALPGVSVSSTGSSFTQVRIRGAEANHTLILIDGIEATGGADEYILTGLETANIARIEVLRGPQSVFYGSNASAGVINIITDKGAPGLHYGGMAELGNGQALSAHVSQRGARGGVALTLSARDDHGYDQSGDGGEKDGIDRKTIGLSADWRLGDAIQLGTTLRWAEESYDYDATSYMATDADSYVVDDDTLSSERREFQGAAWAQYDMLDGRLTHRLEFQKTIYKQAYDSRPFTRGETEKLKYRLGYGLDGLPVDQARHVLNVLAEREQDKNNSAPGYDRKRKSLALEYRGFLDNGLDIQAGIRRDNNKSFEDFTSWNLGISWQLPNRPLRLHASAGSALVNPSYYELYADDGYTLGNPGLKPEINRGFDLGIEAGFLDGRAMIDLTYFKERMQDEITYSYGAAPDGRAMYVNQPGDSPREGVELTGRLQLAEDLSLALNYTYLDAKNPDGSVEIRRPRHELGLTSSYAFLDGRGNVTADIRYVSGNYDRQYWGAYPTKELPSYTVVNLAAGYDLTENMRLTGRVVNLLDEEYSNVWGYSSLGRTAYIGLQAKW